MLTKETVKNFEIGNVVAGLKNMNVRPQKIIANTLTIRMHQKKTQAFQFIT